MARDHPRFFSLRTGRSAYPEFAAYLGYPRGESLLNHSPHARDFLGNKPATSGVNMEYLMLAFLGMWEIILILVICLIFFGAKKLPELAKGLGKGIREFKKASTDVQGEFQRQWDHDEYEEHRRQLQEEEERERPKKAKAEDKEDSVTVESTSDSESDSKSKA